MQEAGLKIEDFEELSEHEIIKRGFNGLMNSKPKKSTQEYWRWSGGESKDGYSDDLPDRVLYIVNDNGNYTTLLNYLKEDPDNLKTTNTELYSAINLWITGVKTSKRYRTICHTKTTTQQTNKTESSPKELPAKVVEERVPLRKTG